MTLNTKYEKKVAWLNEQNNKVGISNEIKWELKVAEFKNFFFVSF